MARFLEAFRLMRTIKLIAIALVLTACATAYRDPKAYWTRPDASLPVLADESTACYRAALEGESPAAFATSPAGPRLLPRTEPPPKLWEREPRQAGFEHFEEQLRYERCMRVRGWHPARTTTPSL
jgi:hypothetical protein